MTARVKAIELALARQRLQLEITAQRAALAGHVTGLQPLFQIADQVQGGVRWLRGHPEVLAAGIAVLAATRADARRFLWRWGQRGFVVWKLWRDGNRWLDKTSARQ